MSEKFSLGSYWARQIEWSMREPPNGFGMGNRTEGCLKHIEAEVQEVRAAEPGSQHRLEELCDIIILSLDAIWREGYTFQELADRLEAKQKKNSSRQWPAAAPDEPSFHVKPAVTDLGVCKGCNEVCTAGALPDGLCGGCLEIPVTPEKPWSVDPFPNYKK